MVRKMLCQFLAQVLFLGRQANFFSSSVFFTGHYFPEFGAPFILERRYKTGTQRHTTTGQQVSGSGGRDAGIRNNKISTTPKHESTPTTKTKTHHGYKTQKPRETSPR